MPLARTTRFILIALLGVTGAALRLAAGPAAPRTVAADGPPERPLQVVFDATVGRVTINHARGVRFESVRGGPQIGFTMVNTTRHERSVPVGFMRLPPGDYDVYASSPIGGGTKLSSHHLAAGWRFVLPAPQTETPLGADVRHLTAHLARARRLLAHRPDPELTRAFTQLQAALARNRADLAATRRTDVLIVTSATRFIQAPVKSHQLSNEELSRRQEELNRLRQAVITAADRTADHTMAVRFRAWFAPPRTASPPRR